MAYTEAQAQALREALASGVLTVEYDGKRVTYRSVAEIKEALVQVETALARDAGTRVRQIRVVTNKGF
jgi:predicted GTPase